MLNMELIGMILKPSVMIYMSEKVPECWIHHVPMQKHSQKSQIFGNMILTWKCPKCDYTEYRNEED